MKKKYCSPLASLFFVEAQRLMATSEFGDPTEPDKDITPTEEPYSGKFQTRRRSVWDGDEEENF